MEQLITFSWTHLFIAFALMMILNIGSVRDGVNGRPERVGWWKMHAWLIWPARDIACALIMVAALAEEPRMWYAYLFAAASHTGHRHLYEWGERNLKRFHGPQHPPAWFVKLRAIYSKIIPWA